MPPKFVVLASNEVQHGTGRTRNNNNNNSSSNRHRSRNADGKQITTLVSRTTNPLQSIESNNRRVSGPGRTGNWLLEIAIGPLRRYTSTRIKHAWQSHTRGLKSKIHRGLRIGELLSSFYNEQLLWVNDKHGRGRSIYNDMRESQCRRHHHGNSPIYDTKKSRSHCIYVKLIALAASATTVSVC